MRVRSVRPDVGRLVFRLFGRSLHPELITTVAAVRIRQEAYTALIQISDAGHVLSICHNGQTLCEVTTSAEHPLPQRKQVISRRLRGQRNESVKHDAGILYHVSFQLEQLDPELFLNFHEELLLDSTTSRLAFQFASSSRLSPAPLSLIQTEERSDSLLIHTFHTFPDNCAVVKTQSLFEM